MGSSNNPNNVSCTHFLPLMRRTSIAHFSRYLPPDPACMPLWCTKW